MNLDPKPNDDRDERPQAGAAGPRVLRRDPAGLAVAIAVTLRVRYPECDPMRVAHHGVYASWFEIARTELLRARGLSYRDCEASGVYFVVARLSTRFRRPAAYDDLLAVEVEATASAGVKIEHRYRLLRGSELLATGETTLACVDAGGRLQPVPAALLASAAPGG
ncbi:acyl-CoA thioesterase [Phycisphaera mikurensis]|uniref:Putative hydrolase n=1 Tax=Phycisphaera mikurensis (strain NBRC 102666 / KCTC 22515 / FYK2301M01) TaxID=1142394 RepID=I0ICG5_PHYMF|nr:thioesterase family protein [Phycisphaera mikurensis]MBB6442171.1 acyl-CoA thioester hydrolase [Phycisphaera mikurensis]BAM02953.1 putative hydrolase [Phycisphaera mikurensis NBRC 102666]